MNRGPCIIWAILVVATSSPSLAEERKEREDRQAGAAVEWSSLVEGWGGAVSFRQWRGRLGFDVGAAFWMSDRRRGYPVTTFDPASRSLLGRRVCARSGEGWAVCRDRRRRAGAVLGAGVHAHEY
jgi:hypothetical protein